MLDRGSRAPFVEGRQLYFDVNTEDAEQSKFWIRPSLYAHEPTSPRTSAQTASFTRLAHTLKQLLAPYGTYSGSAIRTQRVMTYAPCYRLAFTLLNEDATSGNGALAWDVRDAVQSKARLLSLLAYKELNIMRCYVQAISHHYSPSCPSCTTSRLKAKFSCTLPSHSNRATYSTTAKTCMASPTRI